KSLALIEDEFRLLRARLPFLGLWDRRDEFSPAARLQCFLSGLAMLVEFPLPRRPRIRGVENRMVKKWIGHARVHFLPRRGTSPSQLSMTSLRKRQWRPTFWPGT